MRVLHIGKYFPPFAGGIENFMGDLLPALEDINVTTAALVHQHQPSQTTSDAGKNIVRVPSYGRLLYAPLCPGFPFALARIIDDFHPDLLHIHMPNTSAFWALCSPKARKIPWVIHWHADVVSSTIDTRLSLAYKLYRPFEQALLRHAIKIICTTPAYLKSSQPLQKWLNKCTVVPLGINPQRLPVHDDASVLALTRTYWQGTTDFKIVVIGRLTYYKGHEVLIKAAQHLKQVKIIIIGAGERHHHLQEEIRQRNIQDKVELAGHLPDQTLQALIQSADCLCLPSLERTEAFGLVLLEAMRYEKPVIASNVKGSGMGWVVDDNQTGILVPPGNHLELANAMNRLADSPHIGKKMGLAGKQKFDELLQINSVAAEIKKVYGDILSPQRKSTT